MSEGFSEEGFRAYCEANGLLQRDLSRGLVNERIPASEETEARESYYDYMKRRSREEDEKMRSRLPKVPSLNEVVSSETADMICKDALIWHRTETLDDLIAIEDGDKSRWVHPDDATYNSKLLKALNDVLNHFGEQSKGICDRRKERGE